MCMNVKKKQIVCTATKKTKAINCEIDWNVVEENESKGKKVLNKKKGFSEEKKMELSKQDWWSEKQTEL